MVFTADAIIQRFERLLNPYRLSSIRVVKHDPNRTKASVANCLNAGMLLGDVVTVGGRIAPFNLQRVRINLAINFERFWTLASRVWDSKTSGRWELVTKTCLRRVLEKRTSVLVKKPSLVLVDVNLAAFFVAYAKNLVDEKVRIVVGIHFDDSFVDLLLERFSVGLCKCADLFFDRQAKLQFWAVNSCM